MQQQRWRARSPPRRRSPTNARRSNSTSTFSPPSSPQTMSLKPKSSSTTVAFSHSSSAGFFFLFSLIRCFYFWLFLLNVFSVIRRRGACGFEAASAGICPGIGKVGAGVSEGNFPLYPQSDPTPRCFLRRTGFFSNEFMFFHVFTRLSLLFISPCSPFWVVRSLYFVLVVSSSVGLSEILHIFLVLLTGLRCYAML